LKKPRLGGAVYVLPNLLTTGNLFWGFFAIMKALQGEFAWAGSALLLAAVFDMLDGRVARLTKGTSEFGVQYDSLCDLVSFGCAPAIVMYQYGLHSYGRIGWVLCFLFMACGALRLARFNVMSGIGKASGDFTGLPIPMAAAVIATFVLFMTDLEHSSQQSVWLSRFYQEYLASEAARANFLIIAAPMLSIAMVSNIVYRSHKALKIRGIKPFKFLAVSVFVIALLAYQPEAVGFTFCFLYALSGFFEWAVGWKKPTEDDEIFTPFEDDESMMEPSDDHSHDVDAAAAAAKRDGVVHKLGVRGTGDGPKLN
jgi:CDP-diacylglycerol--serine O-phosphatidyltransferase